MTKRICTAFDAGQATNSLYSKSMYELDEEDDKKDGRDCYMLETTRYPVKPNSMKAIVLRALF